MIKKNMLKSYEKIIHPQYGNALHVYNAFKRYHEIIKREKLQSCFLLDEGSWRATKKHSAGRMWPMSSSSATSALHECPAIFYGICLHMAHFRCNVSTDPFRGSYY